MRLRVLSRTENKESSPPVKARIGWRCTHNARARRAPATCDLLSRDRQTRIKSDYKLIIEFLWDTHTADAVNVLSPGARAGGGFPTTGSGDETCLTFFAKTNSARSRRQNPAGGLQLDKIIRDPA